MSIRKIEHVLLISICFLIVIPALYIGRSADTNTFTSWRWVFSETGMLTPFFLLIPAVLCAYALSRLLLKASPAPTVLCVLSIASIIPLWAQPESVIDASRYFTHAKSLKEFGVSYFFREWGNTIPAWTDMPLVSLLYGLLFSWFGESRISIQAFNTVLFALTVLLTFNIGKKLWNEETGWNGGILLIGIPYLLLQVPLMLVDVPAMFFLTLSIYTFLNVVLKGGAHRAISAALALFGALFSKYSTSPMLLIIPLISALFVKTEPKKILARSIPVLLSAGAIAGAVIAVRTDLFLEQMHLLKTFQLPGLSRWQEGFASTFLFQTHPFITGFSLYGIYRAVREKDKLFLIPGWFFIILALLHITRARYIIPLFPLFVLTASYGLNAIRDSGIRKFIVLSIAASSFVIACGAYLPFLKSTSMVNLKRAGEYLNTLDVSAVEVYALPQRTSSGSTFAAIPLLDYYTDKAVVSPQAWPSHREYARPTASLRFTREMKKPVFYSRSGPVKKPFIVLIADSIPNKIPGRFGGGEMRRFDRVSGVFKYRTAVAVYRRD